MTAADATTRYDPFFVKMFWSGPQAATNANIKNNISFKYAQSKAEGILNGQITWNKKNLR